LVRGGGAVREFPVFVLFRREHLATVFTVPDESPRGLVLLLTGAGAARSHRFQMWTRTARELARHGLASARLDYEGMGDSTGDVSDWNWSIVPELQEQARAVAQAGVRTLGVDRVGVAGNCLGSLLTLYLAAAMPECIGSVGILTPLFEVNALTGVRRRVRRWKVASMVKSNPLGRKLLVRPVRRLEGKFNRGVSDRFSRALDHGPMLFMYGDRDDSWSKRVQARLDEMLERVPKDRRERFELKVLPGVELSGFESAELQQLTIDTVVTFMTRCFDRISAPPKAAAPVPSSLDA
jgi:pimeloyl-ACP methyl ester carboxylesterase